MSDGPGDEGGGPMNDETTPRGWIDDDELAAMALGADPNPVIDPDQPPWSAVGHDVALLPGWYMAPLSGTRRGTAAKVTIGVIIASFVVINALGLCVTYGWVTVA